MHSIRKITDNGVASYQVIYVGSAFDNPPFRIIGTFASADDACTWASYLNGGGRPPGPFPTEAPA